MRNDGVPRRRSELDQYLRELSDDDLDLLKRSTLENLNDVKLQLSRDKRDYQRTRRNADPDWTARTEAAARGLGFRVTCIDDEKARRRRMRAERNGSGGGDGMDPDKARWVDCFIDVVVSQLGREAFNRFSAMADRQMKGER